MKKLVLSLLALAAGGLHADTLLISDFSDFVPSVIVQPQPISPADGPWLDSTAQSGATAYTIGDFGSGAPSGLTGNGFIQFLAGLEDWSSFGYLTLTGLADVTNATPFLSFYVEDVNASSTSVNVFDLASFAGGATVTLLLDLSGIDATQVAAWGFVTNEGTPTAFGFTFDNLALSTEAPVPSVPDAGPGLAGVVAAMAMLGLVRRRV